MAWLKRNGEQVDARQFGMGSNIPGQKQQWDKEGAYYIVQVGRQSVRLAPGDWVCYAEDGKTPIDVQSQGKFMGEHMMDPSVPDKQATKPKAAPPTIAMTAEEFAASKAAPKLIADAPVIETGPIELPPEPEIEAPKAKRGRPKGSKNKPKLEGKLPPLPTEGSAAADQLEEV